MCLTSTGHSTYLPYVCHFEILLGRRDDETLVPFNACPMVIHAAWVSERFKKSLVGFKSKTSLFLFKVQTVFNRRSLAAAMEAEQIIEGHTWQ